MTDNTHRFSLTRRGLLRTLASVAGAGAALELGVNEASAAKMSQKVVAYQDTPNGDKRCDGCNLFQEPNACKSVEGTISPAGWCRIWVKKPA